MRTWLRAASPALSIVCLLAPAALPQDRDFLTSDEVESVRLAQEPNERLKLYTDFARLRIELIKQLIAKDKPGRSGMIHSALEDYTRIIEAIDTVTDDALRKNKELIEGPKLVAAAEKEMLAALREMEAANPKDLARYRFALTSALEVTQESLELAQEDLTKRKHDANVRAAEEKKEIEAMMTPSELKTRQAAEAKKAEEEKKTTRKAPTLRRKGEAPAARKP
ncbi:MAG: hypothetical protein JJE04_23170 [Acidobacteriia bacterium]|nr:hypothetical protein [Terriglobia bacterium]